MASPLSMSVRLRVLKISAKYFIYIQIKAIVLFVLQLRFTGKKFSIYLMIIIHTHNTYKLNLILIPLKTYKRKTAVVLHKLNDNICTTYKYHYNYLTQTDTMISKACGLFKVHKSTIAVQVPLRPYFFFTNTSSYELVKILHND